MSPVRTTLLALTAALLMAGCAAVRPATDPDVLARILPASVQVVIERSGERLRTASGVVVGGRSGTGATECFVLTAGHTVSRLPDGTDVRVLFNRHRPAGSRVQGEVLAHRVTEQFDLGLLLVRTEACRSVEAGVPPQLGDPIWTVGFPWGRGVRLSGGVISQVPVDGDGAARLVIDAPVAYGASGSGVYDARTGRLVGLVEGYGTARMPFGDAKAPVYVDVPMPGETYVTGLPAIRRFLREVGYQRLLGAGR